MDPNFRVSNDFVELGPTTYNWPSTVFHNHHLKEKTPHNTTMFFFPNVLGSKLPYRYEMFSEHDSINNELPNTRHPANLFSQAVCGLCSRSFHTSSKVT